MSYWTLDDIPWEFFDRSKLDPEIVPVIKAASLVESNGTAYSEHLCRIFDGDAIFQAEARRWGEDEVRHGRALGRWAAIADPEFDLAAALNRFREGYHIDFDRGTSRRGSRSGEMIARCIVETGTSTCYAALRDGAKEPVLKEICRRIAADEVRHYKLFHRKLARSLEQEPIAFWKRLRIVLGRIIETGDDELAYAFYAANETDYPYDRRRCGRAYACRIYATCREHHIAHGTALVFKAIGLAPGGRLCRLAGRLAWRVIRIRAARLARRSG